MGVRHFFAPSMSRQWRNSISSLGDFHSPIPYSPLPRFSARWYFACESLSPFFLPSEWPPFSPFFRLPRHGRVWSRGGRLRRERKVSRKERAELPRGFVGIVDVGFYEEQTLKGPQFSGTQDAWNLQSLGPCRKSFDPRLLHIKLLSSLKVPVNIQWATSGKAMNQWHVIWF